jgi:hypothetical protein
MHLMNPEYVLQNIKIYEKHLKNTDAQKYFMNQTSTDYIRAYRLGENKFGTAQEKMAINQMINFFSDSEDFIRCAQLQRILKGEILSEKYAF